MRAILGVSDADRRLSMMASVRMRSILRSPCRARNGGLRMAAVEYSRLTALDRRERAQPLDREVEKGAHLARRMASLAMDDVHRNRFAVVVRENRLQLALFQ